MATAPVITGAPTRAPVILLFPETPIMQARRELRACRNERMFERWIARAKQYRGLCQDDRVTIGKMAVQQGCMLSSGSC